MKKLNLKRAAIEIFGGCNYKCTMCPQSTGRGKSWTRKMPLDHFIKLLDQLDGSPLIQLEGSGEAFLAKDLDLYIKECTIRGFKTFIKTNGSFDNNLIEKALDAGLSYLRFSIIGFDRQSYFKHMSLDNWNLVLSNIQLTKDIIKNKELNCELSLYHLITQEISFADELKFYQELSKKLEISSQVWKMHNWSGNIDIKDRKILNNRRSCGRPFADEITIRAGGEPGRYGAVTPCTQTLGPPNETKSILGYSDIDTLYDIWNNNSYNWLRKKHSDQHFDEIEYCKNCDFLYDDPEVLIWTNDTTVNVGSMQGIDLKLFKE